ncbi:ribonuclease [Nocardia sp. CA2R105]|uniref:ribonuclease domain-containing protein n=1 Tax=Nocardia coffeae TaxID=2873381 RepID=UPI001CA7624F|nr:ribonuclease domain-containing protein [Nocardia coffeae]MBY8858075.1 ribonuclease [Nocardia coffeae]
MKLSSKRIQSLLGLGAAIVVIVIGLLVSHGHSSQSSSVGASTSSKAAAVQAKGTAAPATSHAASVPDHAYQTLTEIDAGRWPGSANAPGTKGGDQWMNRSGSLAKTDSSGKAISYQEWDVNPKKRGQTRDAERIITGSDGSAYYTGDHYKTFTRMR